RTDPQSATATSARSRATVDMRASTRWVKRLVNYYAVFPPLQLPLSFPPPGGRYGGPPPVPWLFWTIGEFRRRLVEEATEGQAGREHRPSPDRNLALDLVRLTEAAAMAGGRWVGRGDKNGADKAAVDAMRAMSSTLPIRGVVVIGE